MTTIIIITSLNHIRNVSMGRKSGINGLPGQPDDAITRNHVNILTSNIVIALPGSVGTKNEVELAVKFNKPIVLFGPQEAFADFIAAVPRLTALVAVQDWVNGQLSAVR